MSTLLLARGEDAVPPEAAAAVSEVATTLTDPVVELAIATLILVPVIVIHGWSLGRVSKIFSSHFALYTPHTARWRVTVLVGLTITALVVIHLVETLLWTVPLISLGILDNFRDAYYYVLEAYTTLGEGTLYLPNEWRLVGPVIAISGLFTFGWTASVLVYVMNQTGKLHAERSKAAARGAAPATGEER
ncbi:MAG TPA: two pore domain potassium channel family protein [Bauldia sp.]|nr:two pore domain potassium channel family protein [Bauldia sp.]